MEGLGKHRGQKEKPALPLEPKGQADKMDLLEFQQKLKPLKKGYLVGAVVMGESGYFKRLTFRAETTRAGIPQPLSPLAF